VLVLASRLRQFVENATHLLKCDQSHLRVHPQHHWLSDFYDINMTHLASALRSNADDPISSDLVSDVQAVCIKHFCLTYLFASCGIVEY
jgi:hypothetical protein